MKKELGTRAQHIDGSESREATPKNYMKNKM